MHLHSSAKDGLGVVDFRVSEVTLILGFLKIVDFSLTEMEDLPVVLGPTIRSGCPADSLRCVGGHW